MHIFKQRISLAAIALCCLPPLTMAASLNDSLNVTSATNRMGSDSQQKIDKAASSAESQAAEYRRLLQEMEFHSGNTEELAQLKAEQEAEIAELRQQIEEVKITQQRIAPLMRSMADTLEQFIALDLPFQQEERLARILKLKQTLRAPGIANPEKFRMLLETWQVESDYGRTIEAWRGQVGDSQENQRSVQFLRIGRLALYYQTLDGGETARWNPDSKSYEVLPDGWNDPISTAIRVASSQTAPQMLVLPLPAAGGAS